MAESCIVPTEVSLLTRRARGRGCSSLGRASALGPEPGVFSCLPSLISSEPWVIWTQLGPQEKPLQELFLKGEKSNRVKTKTETKTLFKHPLLRLYFSYSNSPSDLKVIQSHRVHTRNVQFLQAL